MAAPMIRSDRDEASRHDMQALDAGCSDEHHLTGLQYCTKSASRSPGLSTPTASAITGHCVSHCTADPKRLAPQ
jgi:hypothetical protein